MLIRWLHWMIRFQQYIAVMMKISRLWAVAGCLRMILWLRSVSGINRHRPIRIRFIFPIPMWICSQVVFVLLLPRLHIKTEIWLVSSAWICIWMTLYLWWKAVIPVADMFFWQLQTALFLYIPTKSIRWRMKRVFRFQKQTMADIKKYWSRNWRPRSYWIIAEALKWLPLPIQRWQAGRLFRCSQHGIWF